MAKSFHEAKKSMTKSNAMLNKQKYDLSIHLYPRDNSDEVSSWFNKLDTEPSQLLRKACSRNSLLTANVSMTNLSASFGSNRKPDAKKKPASALTSLFLGSSDENPFSDQYSFFCGKGDMNPIMLKIYIPSSNDPSTPLQITVKRDAKVEEVIGYTLYEYINEGREPPLSENLCDVVYWNLRIVEDDGAIDDDFPALERARNVQKFSFDKFALCVASPEECMSPHESSLTLRTVKVNESKRIQKAQAPGNVPMRAPSTKLNNASGDAEADKKAKKVQMCLLRVHLYSTIEVKQTTVLKVPSDTLLSEVFEQICEKRKYSPQDYVLKMADTKTDVPMDKTLEELNVMEFCVLKRDRGGGIYV